MTTHAIPKKNDLKGVWAMRLTDAARRIGCTLKFLHQQIKAGHLRATRLGAKCFRIRPEDLSAYRERRSL